MLHELIGAPRQNVKEDGYGFFSLWDFMQKFNPITMGAFLEAYNSAYRLLAATQAMRVAGEPLPENIKVDIHYSGEDLRTGVIQNFVTELRNMCKEAELTHSLRSIEDLEERLPQTCQEIEFLLYMMARELKGRRFLRIPMDRLQYYESDELLSEKARENFKGDVASEIKSSGTAYACALPNACVFHAMRGAEVGLRIVATSLGVTITGEENLQNVIDGIRRAANKLIEGPKVPGKSEKGRFYSELAIDAGHIKDAWRNYVAHAKANYSDPQALNILNATRHFFEVLSEKFSEEGLPPASETLVQQQTD